MAYIVSGDMAFINNYPVQVDKEGKVAALDYMEGSTKLAPGTDEGYLVWSWMPATAADTTCTDPIRVQDGICLGVKPPKVRTIRTIRTHS